MAFLTISIQGILLVHLSSNQNDLIFQQFDDMLYATWIMLFLVHGARLYWYKTPKLIKVSGFVWYFFLLLSTLFYRMIELPDKGKLIFIEMKNTSSLERGHMLKIGDVYIIGQGFDFLVQLFRIYTFLVLLIAYKNSKEVASRLKILKERRLFMLSIIFGLIYPIGIIFELLWLPISSPIVSNFHIFDVLALFGIGLITIFAPETVLISQVQIIRVTNRRNDYPDANSLFEFKNKSIEISEYIDLVKELYPEIMKSRKRYKII